MLHPIQDPCFQEVTLWWRSLCELGNEIHQDLPFDCRPRLECDFEGPDLHFLFYDSTISLGLSILSSVGTMSADDREGLKVMLQLSCGD